MSTSLTINQPITQVVLQHPGPALPVALNIEQPVTQVLMQAATPSTPITLTMQHITQQVPLEVQQVQSTVALQLLQQVQQVSLVIIPEGSTATWAKTVFTYTADVLTQKEVFADAAGTALKASYQYSYLPNGQLTQMEKTDAENGIIETKNYTYNANGDLINISRTIA